MGSSVKSDPGAASLPGLDRPRARWSAAVALIGAIGSLALVLPRLAPGLLFGDPGEFQLAAWRLGLAHPTGYPLYLLLGWAWQHGLALFQVDPGYALNLLSGLLGALAVGALTWVLGKHLDRPPDRGTLGFGLAGAGILALNPVFVDQSLIAEVYTLHTLLLVLTLGATLRATAPHAQSQGSPAFPLLLLGLTIGHHRTGLFLAPGVLALLLWARRDWWRSPRHWGVAAGALALPQLLYLYIPLRSGPAASPWLYPRLDGQVLRLYPGGWKGFWDFVTGQSLAGEFLGLDDLFGNMEQAVTLWTDVLGAPVLLLAAWGLARLVWDREWSWLALTLPFGLALQAFNLVYAIGDIQVYYIPLYLVAAIWAARGLQELWRQSGRRLGRPVAGLILGVLLLWMWTALPSLPSRAEDRRAREMWGAILAASPPEEAILVTNDRDEMVPLYYLQAVEGRASGITGLFPRMAPGPGFADVGAVVQTALEAGAGRPVYLIKPMPGLEVAFDLAEGPKPLVRVLGPVTLPGDLASSPVAYGPVDLVGVELAPEGDGWRAALYWEVQAPLARDYTVSVQLFDPQGTKLAQDDRPPGGVYYPTSLWKPGQILRDARRLSAMAPGKPTVLRVVFYTADPAGLQPMREPLEISLAELEGP